MKTKRLSIKQGLSLMLVALIASPSFSLASPISTQTLKERKAALKAEYKPKLAPDLEELLATDDENQTPSKKKNIKTLADIRDEKLIETGRKVFGKTVIPSVDVPADESQSFIVQADSFGVTSAIESKVAASGGRIVKKHNDLGLMTIEAPRSVIRQIAADANVSYVSPDRPVAASGHVETTTGATLIRTLVSGSTLDGTGVGVAVLDSGMDQNHQLIRSSSSRPGISVRNDFTGTNGFDDPFGHGSHVASFIMGSDMKSGAYRGVAPAVRMINLVVLDGAGQGASSNIVAAIDWCVANKSAYNLRVINLSLGSMAKDSYVNDPMCKAVRRAVNAGIVVVCAAGNSGKDSSGRKIYGSIHSPGIDPSAITVGAANTFGTDKRSDDGIASYSSKGPTRGYTVVNNARKYDNLIKPDLVAPGNKLIGASSNGRQGTGGNNIISNYPSLVTGNTTDVTAKVVYMSGTSMAAPVVAGAAALMLQANPSLTPSLVKAILMYTAQPLKGFNMFEQGAGELNVDGAVRLAKLVKTTLPTTVGSSLLTASLPTAQSTIAGETFKWGQGVITDYGFLYGSNLLTQWQGVYGSGVVLADATQVSGGTFNAVSGKLSGGVSLKSGAVTIGSSGVVLSDGVVISDGVVLSDGVVISDGVVLADGVVISDGVVLADGTTRADLTLKSASGACIVGDSTASMTAAP